jgi:hypothetical protein
MRPIHALASVFVLTLVGGCGADTTQAPADHETAVDPAQPVGRAREVEAITLEHKKEIDRVLDEQ